MKTNNLTYKINQKDLNNLIIKTYGNDYIFKSNIEYKKNLYDFENIKFIYRNTNKRGNIIGIFDTLNPNSESNTETIPKYDSGMYYINFIKFQF